MRQIIVHVFLGRFSPIHKGHQQIIDKLIAKFGIKNCLVIIGSSTSLNQRTPFTYKTRKRMIRKLYPELKIIGLPDIDELSPIFNEQNIKVWLKNLKLLEKRSNSKFIFYSGSHDDIDYLNNYFETRILVNRNKGLYNISATLVRKGLEELNYQSVSDFVDNKIKDMVIRGHKRFLKSLI